jgi:alkanesulfonate monooxygenase SsuD/methylene tetrahydromethanopterin reductase-like flavin-dependent oxidoreductase (luciferase family)
MKDSPALPKPVQTPRPPVIIGGHGARTTPRLAATYAQEFNLPFSPIVTFRTQRQRVTEACEAIDRDPATMTWSAALVLCCGKDEAEVARRAGRIGREVDELRTNGAAGTPDEVLAPLGTWAEAGVTRAYLQVLDLQDLEHLALVAEAVLPHV